MSGCAHLDFASKVTVNRLEHDGDVRTFLAELEITCSACGQPFHFVGVDAGLSFARPTANVGATMLHAPIAPGEGPVPHKLRFEVG